MDYKHFSHAHGLAYHQMPPGAEIQCSGCKFPGSGNVYSCWQCSYFLHENCFQATRSLRHPSHPMHPLTLVPYPTYPSNSFYCNTCNLTGNALSYSCSECDFDLHVHCAFPPPSFPTPPPMVPEHFSSAAAPASYQYFNPQHAFPLTYPPSSQPGGYYESVQHSTTMNPPPSTSYGYPGSNENGFQEPIQQPHIVPESAPAGYPASSQAKPPPEASAPVHIALLSNPVRIQEVKHFSHQHPLVLKEVAQGSGKVCSGCGDDDLDGTIYSCVDPQCDFNLHKSCFELPAEIRHKSHLDHPLKLLAKPPSHYTENQFGCNACLQTGAAFVYHCEECSFDLHVECVALPESIIRPDHKHPLKLFYSNPVPKKADEEDQVTFVCDVCRKPVHEIAWIYSCHECEFGTHLTCAAFEAQPVQKTEEELVREAEFKMAMLNILINGGLDPAALRKTRVCLIFMVNYSITCELKTDIPHPISYHACPALPLLFSSLPIKCEH